jgi:hypothetical protein
MPFALTEGRRTGFNPARGFHFQMVSPMMSVKKELLVGRVPHRAFAEDDVPGNDVERQALADDPLRPWRQHVDFDRNISFPLDGGRLGWG